MNSFFFRLKGVASRVLIGKAGPALDSTTGVLRIRKNDNSAYDRLQAADPVAAEDVATQGWITAILSGGATIGLGAIRATIHQVAHGFSPGNAVYNNGSSWVNAKSDSLSTLATGIVAEVIDADHVKIQISGPLTLLQNDWDSMTGQVGGLTPGATYYTSSATAGHLTSTAPGIANTILVAQTTLTAYILPQVLAAQKTLALIITQASHGFIVGQSIRPSGAGWALAQADVPANIGTGIVSKVISSGTFEVTIVGEITLSTAQWDAVAGTTGGLTPNNVYYTSPSVAGEITSTEPALKNRMITAQSATVAYVSPGPAYTTSGIDNISRLTVTIADTASATINTVFGSELAGIYDVWSDSDPLLEASLRWDGTNLRVISFDGRVTGTLTTPDSLNIAVSGGHITIENNTGASLTLVIYRRI